MAMAYLDALRWLHTLPDFERTGAYASRPDVEPTRALLAALGDPHGGRATVHIAGSKGKGSTTVMVEAMLQTAGVATGSFVSPHLHRYTERIRIGGAPVSEETFAAAMDLVREAMAREQAGAPGRAFVAFDALTAAAFIAFRDAGVRAQIIEVGLGGRLDPTNVFAGAAAPHVTVITPISLEHTAILGDTVAAIAREKADIIVEGDTVVVAPQRESALDVVREVGAARGARVVEVAASCQITRSSASADGQEFRLRTPRATYGATLPLAGRHQLENTATAVLAAEEIAAAMDVALTPEQVRQGLAAVKWPARLETLKRAPLIVIDGAHNADSAKRMVAALREYFRIDHATFVLGTLTGKDVEGMVTAVEGMAESVVLPAWPHARAADPAALADILRAHGVPYSYGASPGEALDAATAVSGTRGSVVAFGSIAFVALVREYHLGIESDMIRLSIGNL
ncbi:MAG: bifunctional folylpolyglutamate synthase/dihydrofolate synthase [Chloroflexi bacterium]|nr:bifunctional folylpolyglutamate synthase/dihydrofolate synthase [Chloroflexota bacterium]